MSELAVEEMVHFREVIKIIHSETSAAADEKDPYVNEIRSWIRQGSDVYLLTGANRRNRGARCRALWACG